MQVPFGLRVHVLLGHSLHQRTLSLHVGQSFRMHCSESRACLGGRAEEQTPPFDPADPGGEPCLGAPSLQGGEAARLAAHGSTRAARQPRPGADRARCGLAAALGPRLRLRLSSRL